MEVSPPIGNKRGENDYGNWPFRRNRDKIIGKADLDVDTYMELPQGLNMGPESGRYVLKLQKNLCGLKQAGNNWSRKLSSALGNLSIKPRKVDP